MKSWFDPFEFGTGAPAPTSVFDLRWGLIPKRHARIGRRALGLRGQNNGVRRTRPKRQSPAAEAALFDMFCALNGATRTPRPAKIRQRAAVSRLLPTDELAPWIMRVRAVIAGLPPPRERISSFGRQ